METGSGLWETGMAGEGRGREVLTPLPVRIALLSAWGECGRRGGARLAGHTTGAQKNACRHTCVPKPPALPPPGSQARLSPLSPSQAGGSQSAVGVKG